MSKPSADRLDALLDELPWLRNLAIALVGRDTAEDAVQDTVAVALREQHRGRPPTHIRAWLATVLRNRVRQTKRREAQREAVERRRSTREGEPAVTDMLARAELHREITEAVTALPRNQQVVVMLRHFEELDFSTIAARTGLTLEAARSRHRRALATMRENLDRRPGGRTAWVAIVLPTPSATPTPHQWPTWVPVAGAGISAFAAVLGVVALAAALRDGGNRVPRDAETELATSESITPAAIAAERDPEPPQKSTPRTAFVSVTTSASASSSGSSFSLRTSTNWPDGADRKVELRLFDQNERPIPAAEIQAIPVTEAVPAPRWSTDMQNLFSTTTDQDGRVALPWSETTDGELWVRVRRDEKWQDLGPVQFAAPGVAAERRVR